jgi:hypothetical protein
MKTNFTSIIKAVVLSISLFICTNSFASNTFPSVKSGNLKAEIVNNSLVMNWAIENAQDVNYCEVQGSEDGKNFTTIGYVMGATPSQANNTFIFKQALAKMKPGKTYFRVLIISADEKATTSEVVKIAK